MEVLFIGNVLFMWAVKNNFFVIVFKKLNIIEAIDFTD